MKQQALSLYVLVSALVAPFSHAFQPSTSAVRGPLRTTAAPFTLLKDAAAHFPEGSSGVDPSSSSSSDQQSSSSASSSNSMSSRSNKNKSLLRTIDDYGLGLKPKAVKANAKASLAETKSERIPYMAKSCAYYALFILYRAYRGFFIIAPAIFRATCEKLESVVDEAPFDDYPSSDIAEKNKKYPWRTRITVSILAAIVTTSYMVGGAIRVALKLIQSFLSSKDVPRSFQAAASEQERNEAKILRLANKNAKSISSSSINGEEGVAP